MNVKKVRFIFSVLLVSSFMLVQAQPTKKEAVDAYNGGVKLLKTNAKEAIKQMEKCIEISEQLGEEGEETKKLAAVQLPNLYYQMSMETLKAKKYSEAIIQLEKTVEVAEKYNSPNVKSSAEGRMPLIYNALGGNYRKKSDWKNALINYDKAIEHDTGYYKACLGKALVYSKTGEDANLLETTDKTIELAKKANDTKSVATAEKIASTYFYNKGVKSVQANAHAEAVDAFQKSLKYGNVEPDIYLQIAKSNNVLNNWDAAIDAANKALELENGDDVVKAKYYFEIGTSYMGSGDTSQACEAFKKALTGEYEQLARYKMEQELKCQ